jgi:hypothetical protein
LLRHDLEYGKAVDVLAEHGVQQLNGYTTRRIRNRSNLTEVISAVYQVRCNLFHGGKTPENPRDERLVEASHCIVLKLVGPLLGDCVG